MTPTQIISDWKEEIKYSSEGPQHVVLAGTETYRSVLVGLEAGVDIPQHPSTDATYHFLEGSGWMIVDDERYPIEAGSTIVVPAGARRGVEAKTRLAFLGSHGGHNGSHSNQNPEPKSTKIPTTRPLLFLGSVAFLMLLLMGGILLLGATPMTAMMAGLNLPGIGLWGVMLAPVLVFLAFGAMMYFMLRSMTRELQDTGSQRHQNVHTSMMNRTKNQAKNMEDPPQKEVTLNIPSISCGGCKQTIEQKLAGLEGVISVEVEQNNKLATILYQPPTTKADIQSLLETIGYPAEVT